MNLRAPFFQHRSLTFAFCVLLVSLVLVHMGFGLNSKGLASPSPVYVLGTVGIFAGSCVAWVRATRQLIRDVDTGYSPERCSLAAVILLLALVVLSYTGFGLLHFTVATSKG